MNRSSCASGRGQRVRRPIHGHLPFLHRFQERRLCFRRRPVDFIAQNELGEQRSGTKLKSTLFRVENVRADDVGRHQVRRELDALERTIENPRHYSHQQRFRRPRNALDKNVPSGKQGRQDLLNDVILPHDHFADFLPGGSVQFTDGVFH